MTIDEKPTMDDSASETLKSASPSVVGKAEASAREGSQTPTGEEKAAELHRVHSTTKDVKDEMTRVMTSGEGVEYPTGLKLNLISLALCLSVFLMALVSQHL